MAARSATLSWAHRLEAAWWQPGSATPSLTTVLLRPLSWLYGLLWRLRELGYRIGLLRVQRLKVPVIVVGNLIVGGAGKTPTTLALVCLLREHGYQPGIVSRGYGRREGHVVEVTSSSEAASVGDEPLLLRLRTGAPVMVGHDRVAAALALLQRHPEVDVLVCDDGMQHWRLARDLDVVVFDQRGIGNGQLLPAGPLRQPMPQGTPANWLVLYNADKPSTPLPGTCARRTLAGAVALDRWWAGDTPSRTALSSLHDGRPLMAVAGMADPSRFFDMLTAQGLSFERCALPDHDDFSVLPWQNHDGDVIVTEKDAVKLKRLVGVEPHSKSGSTVWVAALDFQPDPAFDTELVRRLVGQAPYPQT